VTTDVGRTAGAPVAEEGERAASETSVRLEEMRVEEVRLGEV